MVNATFDTLKDLMNQFGTDPDIDILVFTGDLIDYGRNYHPKKFIAGTKKTTGDIWQEMMLSNLNTKDKKANIDDYPRSIDNVIMFSLFVYYYQTYGKPIFLTSCNHEGYTLPYGISSRLSPITAAVEHIRDGIKKVFGGKPGTQEQAAEKLKKAEKKNQGKISKDMRANEGISADHNLTMPEAILMYGPGYSEVAMGGVVEHSGHENHRAKNYDWFYSVFTPLSDYSFTWDKQCFMALQWGDVEQMIGLFGDFQEGFTPRTFFNNNRFKNLCHLWRRNTCALWFTW